MIRFYRDGALYCAEIINNGNRIVILSATWTSTFQLVIDIVEAQE